MKKITGWSIALFGCVVAAQVSRAAITLGNTMIGLSGTSLSWTCMVLQTSAADANAFPDGKGMACFLDQQMVSFHTACPTNVGANHYCSASSSVALLLGTSYDYYGGAYGNNGGWILQDSRSMVFRCAGSLQTCTYY
jgi:hypothetical protein